MSPDSFPANYNKFIQDVLLNPETKELTPEQVSTLMNLHNQHVDPMKPAYNRSCPACIARTFAKVKAHYSAE